MRKKINKITFVFGIFSGVILAIYTVVYLDKNSVTANTKENLIPETKNLITKSFKLQPKAISLPVTGIVEYSQKAIVSAKQNGVLTKLSVTEGQKLNTGELISEQEAEILSKKIKLTEVENSLVSTQQSLQDTLNEVNNKKTNFIHQTNLKFSDLKKSHTKKENYEIDKSLIVSLKSAGFLISETFKFIDDNKPLFSAEGISKYEDVVLSWYGKAPDYLNQPPKTNHKNKTFTSDLLKDLEKNMLKPDSLPTATVLVQEYLLSLQDIMQTAEADVFADDFTDLSKRNEYLQHKQRLITQNKKLNDAWLNWKRNLYNTSEQDFNLDTKSRVSDFDTKIYNTNFTYGKQITKNTELLNTAKLDLLSAEQSLFLTTAPFTGQVAEIYTEEGEYVRAGEAILKIVNDSSLELVTQIPSKLLPSNPDILVGEEVLVNGKSVGTIDRLVTVSDTGFVQAFVTITTKEIKPGSELSGYINVETDSNIFSLPKDFIYFKDTEPFIKYEDGEMVRVKIIYDNGADLWVRVQKNKDYNLIPNHGLGFNFED